MTRAGAIALALVAAGLAEDRARGDAPPPPRGFLMRTLAGAEQALAQLAASRVPPLQPPTPVAVAWRARRLVSIDLGAPLVELAAGDLDGDGRAELVALTTRDVVVLGARGARGLVELARVAVPADAPAIEPRDPIGTVVITRADNAPAAEISARVSTAGRGARYALSGADLREQAPLTGFPWCAPSGGRAARAGELVPGRDYFGGDGPERIFAVRCRDDLVDETGRPLTAVATLGPGGVLDVALTTRCVPDDRACPPERHVQVAGAGAAFAIADVDHDGRPDVIASGDGAPGDPDSVSVWATPRAGEKAKVDKPVYRKRFNGGVAGLAAADLDGNGTLDVVAAVRLAGATRVDFWLLD